MAQVLGCRAVTAPGCADDGVMGEKEADGAGSDTKRPRMDAAAREQQHHVTCTSSRQMASLIGPQCPRTSLPPSATPYLH
eukprot:14974-Eustigmatos_ZCMA.PRE.1